MALLGVAQSENRIVSAQAKLDQAYYTARAVVAATEQWISNNYNARDEMLKVVPSRSSLGSGNAKIVNNGTLDGKTYDLKVWRDSASADRIYIQADATFDGFTRSAQMYLDETVSGPNIWEDAIYSEGPFGKSSGNANQINGSVATGSTSIPSNLNVNGGTQTNKYYNFTDINPPDTAVFPAKIITASLTDNAVINSDPANLNASYGTLTLSGDVSVNNVDADGNPVDVHIKIENLTINKNAVLYPIDNAGGRIFIYVLTSIYCDMKFGIGGNDTAPIVYLICNGTGSINFSGNPVMDVFLYAPDVNVEYGGTTTFNGALIANVFGWNGNITVNYRAPDLANTPFHYLDETQKTIAIRNRTWLPD